MRRTLTLTLALLLTTLATSCADSRPDTAGDSSADASSDPRGRDEDTRGGVDGESDLDAGGDGDAADGESDLDAGGGTEDLAGDAGAGDARTDAGAGDAAGVDADLDPDADASPDLRTGDAAADSDATADRDSDAIAVDDARTDADAGWDDAELGVADADDADLLDPGTLTTLRIHYDTGLGNRIAVRGAGAGLSWDANADTTWTPGNVWVYETDAWDGPVEWKPVFVHEGGAIEWAEGANYLVAPGATLDIYPWFFETEGTVTSFALTPTGPLAPRTVRVYLPPSYEELGTHERSYPVLFFQDGQNLFDPSAPFGHWALDDALDALMTYGRIDGATPGNVRELIVIAPDASAARVEEYTPSEGNGGALCSGPCGGDAELYLDMLLDEVLPAAAARYRIDTDAVLGIGGSSLGGLISLYAAWTRPAEFPRAAVLSPSLWWDDGELRAEIGEYDGARKAIRLYLDTGTEEGSIDTVPPFRDELFALPADSRLPSGEVLCLVGAEQAHNEPAWADRVPWALSYLFADPARVQVGVPRPSHLTRCEDYEP